MKWLHLSVPCAIIIVATAIRALVFAELGRGTAYLTYYPAVVLAALYGGLYSGLLATAAAAALAFYWIQGGHLSRVETLALAIFVLSCSMISGIAEAVRRAEARARLEKERAQAANLAKSTFLARMSHELRTPLNAILGFTALMRRAPSLPTEHAKSLDIISRSGEHLLALINEVLDLSKIDAGRVVLVPSTFDLHTLVIETTELLRARAQAKDLQLTVAQSHDLPQFVRADETKLRQILINLVGNAIKFTDQGGVVIRLRAQPADAPMGSWLTVEVQDSGIGISAQDQEHIFDPFVQVAHGTRHPGTGLGLTITRKFVDLMGGRISVQSDLGKGSVFRVEVPVGLSDASQVPSLTDPARVIRLAPGQPERRILIVDDQMENWLLLESVLANVGFQVRVAESGAAAVEVFSTWRPDFIWMDVRMPVMDGLEAARRIRALEGGRNVRIAAITASVFREEIDNVKSAGMDDLVLKPYRPEQIYECLVRHLGVVFERERGPRADAILPVSNLRSEALTRLPDALLTELGAALATLDSKQILAVIDRIAKLDPVLGERLMEAAGRLDYSQIFQALKAGETPTPLTEAST